VDADPAGTDGSAVAATPSSRAAAASRIDRAARQLIWRVAPAIRRQRRSHPPARPGTVLHVTTSFDLGGTQTQIKHLCTAPSTRYVHSATELFPELNFLYRQEAQLDPARYVTGGPVARLLGKAVLNRNRRGFHQVQIHKLARDFAAERPEFVVGWGHEVSVLTFVAAAIARVPHVVFCIRTFNPSYGWTGEAFGADLQAAHRRMLPQTSAVIVNSTLLRDDYAAWTGTSPQRIKVCPNGISIETFSPAERTAIRDEVRRSYGISEDAVVVTSVARFSPEKGQRSLIEASRLLREQPAARPIVWLLAGDGSLLEDSRRQAQADGADNIVFAGRTRDVARILAASDIFVMPSRFEGMPNAMMEAMASGLASISTTRSGALDIARDGIEAVYYEADDVPRLAALVRQLVDQRERALQIGEAAAERLRRFDVPAFVAGFESILEDARGPAH
jgi:glycosyltransferase involved in cell wall biosynthesis